MNHFEIQDSRWARYERVVKDPLMNPDTAPWLDGSLDRYWTEDLKQKRRPERGRRRIDLYWRDTLKRVVNQSGGILFWILHITSALGFVLIANAPEPGSHLLVRM